jgi:hypothetical protein
VLTTLVRGMHAGISGRVFDSIGPSAKPIRTIHDGLTQWNHGNVLTEQESPLAGAMTWSDRKALLALASHDLFPFEPELGLTLTGLNHFDLLNHPLVYAKLHDWLAHSPDRSSGVSDTGGDVNGDG